MVSERGQATIEWVGLVALVSLSLGALTSVRPDVDGRSFGAFLTHSLVCAVRGGCAVEDRALRLAYGGRDAELVRRYAPGIVYEPGTFTLPVDFRRCRSHICSDAPDDRDLDVHYSARGALPATAFTHVARSGGETFIQYGLYYPDSTTTWGGARRVWGMSPHARLATWAATGSQRYPGFHPDDWEGYQVRIDRSGRAWGRATAHHGYRSCKQRRCAHRWLPVTGWTRVSRGSHAGHLPVESRPARPTLTGRFPFVRSRFRYRPLFPGRDLHERTTSAPGLALIPLETLPDRDRVRFEQGIEPPWRKEVYGDPRSESTS